MDNTKVTRPECRCYFKMSRCKSLPIYKDGHVYSSKVKPNRLECLLVVRCSTGLKPPHYISILVYL